MLNDIDFKEILQKGGLFTVLRGFAFLFGYIFSWLTIKYYGSEVYGLVTLSFTLMVIFSVVSRYGLDINLTKVFGIENSSLSSNHYKISILTSLTLSILISLPLILFSETISLHVFNKPEFSSFLKWTAISIPLWSLILINTGVFRGLKEVQYYGTLDTFGRFLISILVLLFFVKLNYQNSEIPLISHTTALLILVLVSSYIITKRIDLSRNLIFMKSRIFLISSLPIMITTSIVIMLAWADKLFLGIFDSKLNIGVYDICVRIAGLLTFSLEGINAILSPKISSYYQKKEWHMLNRIVQFGSKINIGIALALLLGILLLSNDILLLFGEDFIIGKTALIILLFGQLVNSYCGPVGNILMMTNNQIPFRNIMISTLFVNIILNFILVPSYSILGASIATSVSLVIWNVAGVVYLKNKFGIQSYYLPKIPFNNN